MVVFFLYGAQLWLPTFPTILREVIPRESVRLLRSTGATAAAASVQ